MQSRQTIALLAALLAASCVTESEPERRDRTDSTPPTEPPTKPEPTLPTIEFPDADIVLNEVMARNDSVWLAPEGDRPDWLEIVNVGEEPVQWSRVRITDLAGNEWKGGSGSMAPGARVVLSSTDLGFSMDSDEDAISLIIDGEVRDTIDWLDLERDVSLARTPDVIGEFVRTALPTPEAENLATVSTTLDAATEHIFLNDFVHRIDFTLTPQAYAILNTRDENWASAGLTFDGMVFSDIGLRLKGSASFALMNGKPAFKVDMNKGVAGQRLRTLKGFNLHNGNVLDPTRARDYISYSLAREAGIMAPRVGWAEVYANGNYYGIYMIIEQHDDQMIEASHPGMGATGVMFEPNESRTGGWGWNDFGSGNTDQWDYEEGPIPPDPEVLASLAAADALVAGAASNANVEELWTYVDKDNLMSYMAWESVVSHGDGYKAPNNWRVFIHPDDKKIRLVPAGAEWTWDMQPFALSWGGRLASWCLDNQGCRRDYGERAIEVAAMVEDMGLQQDFQDVSTMLAPIIALDTRSPHSSGTVDDQRSSTNQNLVDFPAQVTRDICNDMPSLDGCVN
jgi:hypothetical protein